MFPYYFVVARKDVLNDNVLVVGIGFARSWNTTMPSVAIGAIGVGRATVLSVKSGNYICRAGSVM